MRLYLGLPSSRKASSDLRLRTQDEALKTHRRLACQAFLKKMTGAPGRT
ncbi:hypothetical protein HRU45_01205 [Candidatus Dependentiae bacterium]|nr:hypothetical protein [Candidatus Dependentiae bacterium]